MKRATETRAQPRSLAALVVALAVLAGCEETLSPDGESSEAATEDTQKGNPIELFPSALAGSGPTVEAPEAFQVTEAGLWDGRPSLGGIWVAHPDVTQPERVVIKNTTNNKSINGALFRRERNLPGPTLQLSSAAAEKLGILAGSPTKVEVIALRRKPVEKEEAPAAQTADEAPAELEPKTQDDAIETASADKEKPAKRKWWQKKETVAAAGVAGAAAAATADNATEVTSTAAEEVIEATADAAPTANHSDPGVTPSEAQPKKRKWWQKKETVAAAGVAEATTAATAEDATEATSANEEIVEATAEPTPTANLSDPEVIAPEAQPKKRKWWQKKDPDAITETPLDPIEGAAAAIEASAPTLVSANTAAAETASRSLKKPFVQVGTFKVEKNAKSAASKIERNGIPARVRELKTGDKTVWRVLVGPAANRAERNAMQSDVKDLGFTDAFTVKN